MSVIHIAGTNGKGSTSAMVSSVLRSAGYKVGLYTSPHLIRFNERITVDGECISDVEIESFVDKYKKDIDEISSTFFETTTAMAFTYFAKKKVDYAVVEVGLGGRLDATNVVIPQITAITPISLDHKDILGDNLLSIAREKAGVIKNKIPVVIGQQEKNINVFLHKIANEKKSLAINIEVPKEVVLSSAGTHFTTKWGKFLTPLIGYHQASNAVTAITITKKVDVNIKTSTIQKGLKKTVWMGRLQKLSSDLPIYYDVAHNPAGITAITNTIKSIYGNLPNLVMCLKGDKELKLIAKDLKNNFEKLIITGSKEMELMEAQELHFAISKLGLTNNIEVQNEPTKAFSELINHVKRTDQPGVIIGSHYIANAVFDKFGIFM